MATLKKHTGWDNKVVVCGLSPVLRGNPEYGRMGSCVLDNELNILPSTVQVGPKMCTHFLFFCITEFARLKHREAPSEAPGTPCPRLARPRCGAFDGVRRPRSPPPPPSSPRTGGGLQSSEEGLRLAVTKALIPDHVAPVDTGLAVADMRIGRLFVGSSAVQDSAHDFGHFCRPL